MTWHAEQAKKVADEWLAREYEDDRVATTSPLDVVMRRLAELSREELQEVRVAFGIGRLDAPDRIDGVLLCTRADLVKLKKKGVGV